MRDGWVLACGQKVYLIFYLYHVVAGKKKYFLFTLIVTSSSPATTITFFPQIIFEKEVRHPSGMGDFHSKLILNWVSPSVSLIKIFYYDQLLTRICVKFKTCQKHATTLA